ncbi:hypothetical protein HGO26_11090 [Shewanella sp. S-1]|uniref:Uncharacterized protein n=1 Tax=Shewanella oncorhynchi TaxID=2726434 RepID=A0ABX1KQN9_9GAMM|nr:hypothetical protein [Shewanella oncorhynchi]NLQ23417.1 hypothetical protein [Shewanella oncorhynchi]
MHKRNWPADYPAHVTVPPVDATEQNVRLYRLVENNPPIPYDFVASYKDRDQAHLVKFPKFSNCPNFYGTSMFRNKQAAENLIQSNPHRFRKKSIASGDVLVEHGVVGKESSNNHVTVWFFDGTSPDGFALI